MSRPHFYSKALIVAAFVGLLTPVMNGPANAISRIETTKTDCSVIRATLIREGAAILRHTSKKGLPIYDRYVSSSQMCRALEIGVWASVPARDTRSCRVIACDVNGNDDDFGRFRPLLRITN